MNNHPTSSVRHLSDIDLSTRSTSWLYDLAEDCDIEPADPTVCDACAAYTMAQGKESSRESLSDEILRTVSDAAPPSVEMLKLWLKIGKNGAVINKLQNTMGEWAQGWNAAVTQLQL